MAGRTIKNIDLYSPDYLPYWIKKCDDKLMFQSIFNNNKPNKIEIGCGNGHFLIEMAQLYPDYNFIGIELKKKRFIKSICKAMFLNLGNIKFMFNDGVRICRKHIPLSTVSEVFINFPDTWIKRRHNNRRIYNHVFNNVVHRILVDGGKITFASDFSEYFFDVLKLLEGHNGFKNVFHERYKNYYEGYPMSLYEDKWRIRDRKIYFLQFEKV